MEGEEGDLAVEHFAHQTSPRKVKLNSQQEEGKMAEVACVGKRCIPKGKGFHHC